ncbi:MAG: class I SAM-dependent methyltransferase [Phycisphaerae bacterium]
MNSIAAAIAPLPAPPFAHLHRAPAGLACRGCDAGPLALVLDLGTMPLANGLLESADLESAEPRHPLRLARCAECGLVQILDTVAPETLFAHYAYFSSSSSGWLAHARRLADSLITARRLSRRSQVVEIASNDGYLLRNFVARGIPALGVDPAGTVAAAAERAGVQTLCAFFNRDLACRLRRDGTSADVVIANNVLAHVPDPVDVLTGMRLLLRPGGTVEIEVPWLCDLVEKTEFDTIYHEHIYYYSLTALAPLCRAAGLEPLHVLHLPTHGGSLHLSAGLPGDYPVRPSVAAWLADEARRGVRSAHYFTRFATRAVALRGELRATLAALKRAGHTLAAYGAAAKGATLLNFCGLGRETLDFVVDRSAAKHGRFMPGSHLPILPTDELLHRRPAYALLLAWNWADEILVQQRTYRAAGGRFIIPLPTLRIV